MASPYSLSDNQVIQAPYALSKAAVLRATLDLRTAAEAWVFMGVGLSGSTSLTNGVLMQIRRMLNNDTGAVRYCAPLASLQSRITVGQRAVNNGAGYAAGASSFAYDGTGGTAMVVGDYVCFWGVDAVPGADGAVSPANGSEFLQIAIIGTPLVTNSPCGVAKIDNEVFGQADCMNVWLPGGSTYEFTWDYGDDAAGDRVLCQAHAQIITYA